MRTAISVVAVGLVAASITVIFLCMRAALGVGGFCAQGGPYQIRVECPQGIEGLLIGAVLIGLFAALAFPVTCPPRLAPWSLLAWSGLFLALAWNFFEYGLAGADHPFVLGRIILGIAFAIMGLGPLVWLIRREFNARGRRQETRDAGHARGASKRQGTAEALARLEEFRASGTLSRAEYERAKARLLGGASNDE